jgi:hypothetical protein
MVENSRASSCPKLKERTRMPTDRKDNSRNAEAEAALRALFRSEYAPTLLADEEETEPPAEVFITDEDAARMFVQIVADRIRKRYPDPRHGLENVQPIWCLVEGIRVELRLLQKRIDAALDQPPGFTKEFETGRIILWELPPSAGVKMVKLFNLHFESLPDLLRWSAAAYKAREAAKRDESSYPPINKASAGALRMFDIAAARMDPNTELPAEAEAWMGALRSELERLEYYDLLN